MLGSRSVRTLEEQQKPCLVLRGERGAGNTAMLVFWLLCGRGLGVDTLSGQEGCLHWSQ